ncbi:hypothetical protein MUN84_08285 [Hymenobacter sp. 5516J-16]|uniref:Lipoprotein n=1 Tax=Hymenobacter sublimis TaxID=2933777 RepID=A0ABY4J959_9BACT|nr:MULTISPECIES: hypothetical protein [Hymenobacter]UOQ78537.1 hypothetical protein MUN84_08285 [Hymenobacter sp. 5516J-16]UPL48513.1 hypothetical protein MWH26_15125 [Hymenobacter sublimis]
MKTAAFLRAMAAAVLLTTSLTACNTGDKAGDTNVERSEAKDPGMDTNMPSQNPGADSATSGTDRNTKKTPTGREVYEDGANRKDRNNDGLAD